MTQHSGIGSIGQQLWRTGNAHCWTWQAMESAEVTAARAGCTVRAFADYPSDLLRVEFWRDGRRVAKTDYTRVDIGACL